MGSRETIFVPRSWPNGSCATVEKRVRRGASLHAANANAYASWMYLASGELLRRCRRARSRPENIDPPPLRCWALRASPQTVDSRDGRCSLGANQIDQRVRCDLL